MKLHTLLLASLFALIPLANAAQEKKEAPDLRQLSLENRPWKGDFDQMLERRMIRALVPYSRTLYFVDKGYERGVAADLLRDFERYINRKYAKRLGRRPLTVYIIPTTRDKLLSGLEQGLGDIAAGNLTATPGRLKVVDFVAPKDALPASELLITGPKSPAVATIDDLSGQTVHVRPASSYYQSLIALNQRLKAAGKPPVKITPLPDELEDEDILEMLNAGQLAFTVVDAWKAKIWAQVLPKIKVRNDIVLRNEGYTGWAIRKKSPELEGAILDYYKKQVVRTGGINSRIASYNKRIKQISNNTGNAELKRFESTLELFEEYGGKYGFDPLMLAAQGYQESRLDQNARSHVGAIGVMQIMPATGKELRVGNIHKIEPNIHGGAKYMDQLMTRYFPDAKFSETERPLFAFASYNAGPGNISKMRKLAAKRGLDPDKWFNNVEIVVAEKIGIETTTYVRNIYKYYVAYKLILDAQAAQQKAREGLDN
ncbi:transglycosylase SLT domain-containing protein [Oxalicibacterium solurbis]|uniref:Peptidoglycan lytic exotransglycosylase n=1 Tax=Oxalicibacterium solurbis TaxID=69280 RepID=A0A8J3F494_9BURK|nr:transglycosylase SLT domain-containing protein [Oxalicibacterium solurbis]GGI52834.1 peptidoglycan lytic exotransglycosylase [Oxalicibacterium solurbis]